MGRNPQFLTIYIKVKRVRHTNPLYSNDPIEYVDINYQKINKLKTLKF